ncbi:hypothetical protein [Roseicella sp. DB1501]|uniref:hypothetical protein n=1 Tax=Roseicella sp. DB1501 TaxID=2730925 RepID=UPI0014910CB9|nr:hypothetical protein [Roseicella sp. DB1501]NOG71645.1 hypothetical protein [Roseicella sp. DB1501]
MGKLELIGLSDISMEQLFSKITKTEALLHALKHELVRRCRPELENPILHRHSLSQRSIPRKARPVGSRPPLSKSADWRD